MYAIMRVEWLDKSWIQEFDQLISPHSIPLCLTASKKICSPIDFNDPFMAYMESAHHSYRYIYVYLMHSLSDPPVSSAVRLEQRGGLVPPRKIYLVYTVDFYLSISKLQHSITHRPKCGAWPSLFRSMVNAYLEV